MAAIATVVYLCLAAAIIIGGVQGSIAARGWGEYLRYLGMDVAGPSKALMRVFFGGYSLGRPDLTGAAARSQLIHEGWWAFTSCLLNVVIVWLLALWMNRRASVARRTT